MFNTIAILGIGTLGGFVADAVSRLETTKNLMVVDHDIVEAKNLKNSIYERSHIGNLKVDAIQEILTRDDRSVKITKVSEKFEEDTSVILGCDLIIDCRDFVYDRYDIDVRMYMSARNLIIDCRQTAEYKQKHEGKYITRLSKSDLYFAANAAMRLFSDGSISRLMSRNLVHRINLDHISSEVNEVISLSDATEQEPEDNRLINLVEYIPAISEQSRLGDMKICVGDPMTPLEIQEFKRGELVDSEKISETMTQIINNNLIYNYYIVAPVTGNMVELIPETGAA